jgi:hypothetical protein
MMCKVRNDIVCNSISLILILTDNFDLDNFIKSVKNISDKTEIPLYVKSVEDFVIVRDIEIYLFIYNNKLEIHASHRYYDAVGIFKILSLIDDDYNKIENQEPILIDQFVLNNKNSCSHLYLSPYSIPIAILLNTTRKKRLTNEKMHDWIIFKKTKNKTIDIIKEIQSLFKNYNLFLPVNIRKTLNLHKDLIGFNTSLFYVKNTDTNIIENIKSCKNEDDFNKSIDEDTVFKNKNIFLNSYMQYKYPSYVDDMILITPDDKPNAQNLFNDSIIITPKDKEGYSKVFMSTNLAEIIQNTNL